MTTAPSASRRLGEQGRRRPALLVLVALALGSLLVPSAATAARVGPGGWGHVGFGAHPGLASLNFTASTVNADKPGALLVGGAFTDAGALPNADRIASWDGSQWAAVSSAGSQIDNGIVEAIAYDTANSRIFAGGTFLNAGGNPDADFLAVWNGTTWAPFCNDPTPPAFGGNVDALQIVGNVLFVGGSFQDGASLSTADYLLMCDLTSGAATSPYVGAGDGQPVYDLTASAGGTVYVAGPGVNYGGVPAADYVAAYSGGVWSALGAAGSVTGITRSIQAEGSDVYIGSDGVDVAGIALADHVARWDGSAWHALGSNSAVTNGFFPTSASINAILTTPSGIFVGGQFQDANGLPTADAVASYTPGGGWDPLGSDGAGNGPMSPNVLSMALFGGVIYATGGFTSAGGDTRARGIACLASCTPIRSSSTTGSCQPQSGTVGAGFTCQASVQDGYAVGPGVSGVVNFVTGSTGTFSSAACTLTADAAHPGTSSCAVTYTPGVAGTHQVSMNFPGNDEVAASTASSSLSAVAASNAFAIKSSATCSGPCNQMQVKADFDSAGKVVATQVLQGGNRDAVLKSKAAVKKLSTSVKAGRNKLMLKLTPIGKATLRQTGKLVVKLKFTFTPTGGAPLTHVKKFTLKQPG